MEQQRNHQERLTFLLFLQYDVHMVGMMKLADIPDLKSGAGCPGVWVRLPLPTPLSNNWTVWGPPPQAAHQGWLHELHSLVTAAVGFA